MDIPQTVSGRLSTLVDDIEQAKARIRVTEHTLDQQQKWLQELQTEHGLLEKAVKILKDA